MILYTKEGCEQSLYVKSVLQEKNVDYFQINLDDHPQTQKDMLLKGYCSAPILRENGHYFVETSVILTKIEALTQKRHAKP